MCVHNFTEWPHTLGAALRVGFTQSHSTRTAKMALGRSSWYFSLSFVHLPHKLS